MSELSLDSRNLIRIYEGIGSVRRNVLLPEKVIGQMRQVNVLLGLEAKGYSISIPVDEKPENGKFDVEDIEVYLRLRRLLMQVRAS